MKKRENKIGKNKYTDKNTEVEKDWACIKNETRFVAKNCANMGTRREEKEKSSERNLEKNS